MCVWGDDVLLNVPMPARLSHAGRFRWDLKSVDKCIAPIVDALNRDGIYTANSCCGHGNAPGLIFLHDGRTLRIDDEGTRTGERT